MHKPKKTIVIYMLVNHVRCIVASINYMCLITYLLFSNCTYANTLWYVVVYYNILHVFSETSCNLPYVRITLSIDNCAICLEQIRIGYALHCNHIYHPCCINQMLHCGINTCPQCRRVINSLKSSNYLK